VTVNFQVLHVTDGALQANMKSRGQGISNVKECDGAHYSLLRLKSDILRLLEDYISTLDHTADRS
jgi:hypothetical protein